MKQFKIRQLNAAEATVSFCETTATDTSGITNFAPLVAVIKSKIVIVHGFNVLGGIPLKGITINVKATRESMEQHTYKLASAVFSFGAAQSPADNDLMAQAKLSKGSLEKMSKTKCGDECDRIRQLAADHAADILAYGVVASDITDTAALVTLYRAATDDRRAAEVTRSAANSQASATLKNIMDNLLTNQLDTMANTLRYSNNTWWNQYRAAREIIDPGAFNTVLKIYVVNQANDEPLLGVKSYRDNAPEFKKSSTLGFITYKDIEEGPHSFVLKHKLFKNLTIPLVMISHGKNHNVTAKMIPITSGNAVVVFPIIFEGNLNMGNISSFELLNIDADAHPDIVFTFENTGTSTLRFYGAAAAGNLPPASPVLELAPGNTDTKTVAQLISDLGVSSTNHNLNVYNVGPSPGHFKVTIEE